MIVPPSITLNPALNQHPLPLHGQGVFLFQASDLCTFQFCDASHTKGLHITFGQGPIIIKDLLTGRQLIDVTNSHGLISIPGAYYWFSLDAHSGKLMAGIGEPRFETVHYRYSGLPKALLEDLAVLTHNSLTPLKLLRDPITKSVPLLVKPTDELSMDDVAQGNVLPKANLAIQAQKLYDCISGRKFVLNDPSFPEFSLAIEQSIRDPSGWCYQKLLSKATEFSKDKPNYEETYLRITLGHANGESPGIPYVMEIWPPGHYSPIHAHANAHAIIRVLHGSIHVSLYPFLGPQIRPFAHADFSKGDITWMSPTLNTIHQLHNIDPSNTCITIQCYMYGGKDRLHYDFFDYLDEQGSRQQYDPDSDMDFVAFKALMKEEWSAFNASASVSLPSNNPSGQRVHTLSVPLNDPWSSNRESHLSPNHPHLHG
jgi:predicted metal-dependent enzyme (double-stranded beta helix superfamily)